MQPLIQQKRNDGSLQTLPVLQDAGNERELIFQDRCSDAWFKPRPCVRACGLSPA
nr:hypothetical protein [Xylella fastidiosa]